MNTTTRKHRIAALLTVIGALLILGGTAQAATSKPAGMSNAEYRALMLRSEALNKKYHLSASAPATRVVTAAAGFSWSAFGIGAAAMLGLVLLASGAIVGSRHGWRTPRTSISS